MVWWTVSCMVLYYSVVLYSNLSVSKPVVDGIDVGDDLESMPTKAGNRLEHPVTGDSESDGMIAFIPYMLMAYIVVLYSNLGTSEDEVLGMDVLGDDLEDMPTEAGNRLEHQVTGSSETDGMIAFIPYMLMTYLTVLIFQAF